MRILNGQTTVDFMSKRLIAAVFSGILMLVSLGALFVNGLNFGIDFTGGTLVEMGYGNDADLEQIRVSLSDAGFADAVVQHFGTSRDVQIRVPPQENVQRDKVGEQVVQALQAKDATAEMRRLEFVGPQIGDELAEDGALALLYALVGILIYVAFRFQLKLSVGAILALIHDVTITLGTFALFKLDFDLTVLAALLAVIGYSLNDTIVVYDRIRENFRKMRRGAPVEVANASINQTLSRTLMTSGTTLVVLFALYFLGGSSITGFAFALIVGIFVGTYSSIYVASAAAVMMGLNRTDLMLPEKEGQEELDSTP